ncbi:hypothetical protein [Azospirillum canadense]|uniref:hypothetical protein n=1 Tax=Azospirillum canadense TaxID=403962 RepID=UPI002227FC93|nr:hypothetical protein [Azospirillum canadense]MCW2235518.1 hypothetical protein [Azospirillum canadense]
MRGWMRWMNPTAMVLSALVLASGTLAAGGASAQNSGKPAAPTAPQAAPQAGQATPPAASGTPKTMAGSPLTQVPFDEQPFPLMDDGTYKNFLAKVATDVGRRCGKQESYGWEFRKGDQQKMDHIFQSTMDNFGKTGWSVGQAKSKSVADPETAVYTADKDKRRILLVWVPMADAAMLLLCETEVAVPKK